MPTVNGQVSALGNSISPSTRFAIKLFRQVAHSNPTSNIILSPASVMLGLGMLHAGATGETKEAITRVLELPDLEPEKEHLALISLKSALQCEGQNVKLELANALWCDQRFTPRSEFVSVLRYYFEAEVGVLDFSDPDSSDRINDWVSAKTHGKIDSIIDHDPSRILAAINALYFKALWSTPFRRESSRNEVFHTKRKQNVKVPFMGESRRYSYFEEPEFQAVHLYYEGSRLGVYIFLPKTLDNFLSNLTPGAWEAWTKRFDSRCGNLRLPRFSLGYDLDLKEPLKQLGMEMAFDDRAQFDAISSPPPTLLVSRFNHKARIEVNEEGTELVAATVFDLYFGECAPIERQPPFEMIVNRPFFFAIRDNTSNTFLLMGTVGDPSCSDSGHS